MTWSAPPSPAARTCSSAVTVLVPLTPATSGSDVIARTSRRMTSRSAAVSAKPSLAMPNTASPSTPQDSWNSTSDRSEGRSSSPSAVNGVARMGMRPVGVSGTGQFSFASSVITSASTSMPIPGPVGTANPVGPAASGVRRMLCATGMVSG